jgi:glycosyltransferase involved in cell wall biosynthesis
VKILHISPNIPEDIGYENGKDFVTKAESHQRYCYITEQLGYEVEFAYLTREFESYDHPKFGHKIIGFPVSFKLPYTEISVSLLRYLWTEDFDIVYLNTFYAHRVIPILITLRLSETPVVLHHHGDKETAFRFRLHENIIKLLLCSHPSQVFAVNQAAADHLDKVGIKNVDHLAHGIDDQMFEPIETEEASRVVGFSKNTCNLLFVGRIKKLKGVIELLEAIKELINKNQKLELHLVYAGADDDTLDQARQFINAACIDDHIHFVGKINRRNLYKYYSAADICVFPSIKEGFGMVPAEAMSCASAVIVTTSHKRAGHDVVNEQNSLVVEPGSVPALVEAIDELMNNADKRVRLGRNARQTVKKNYNWDAIRDALDKTFTKLNSK